MFIMGVRLDCGAVMNGFGPIVHQLGGQFTLHRFTSQSAPTAVRACCWVNMFVFRHVCCRVLVWCQSLPGSSITEHRAVRRVPLCDALADLHVTGAFRTKPCTCNRIGVPVYAGWLVINSMFRI